MDRIKGHERIKLVAEIAISEYQNRRCCGEAAIRFAADFVEAVEAELGRRDYEIRRAVKEGVNHAES